VKTQVSHIQDAVPQGDASQYQTAPVRQPLQLECTGSPSKVAALSSRAAPRLPSERSYWFMKQGMDVLLSGSALLVLLPVFAVLWFAVRRDGGKAFFGHTRIGRHGRPFQCLKFRSMVLDADAALARMLAEDPEAARQWALTRKLPRDPRVTPLGAFLRSSSLDEIPQLLNVLRGDMSLVGPRPVVQSELDLHYGPDSASYLLVRPGITGLWQTSGRSGTSYTARVALDNRYVNEFSLAADLRILLRTIPAVLKRTGAY
jgi:exopolysaccharide production protein ExoY